MEDGNGGDTINPWTIALFRSLKLVNPKSASEQAAYSKWLDQTSDREEARRDRLHGAEGITPELDLARPVPDRRRDLRLHVVLRGQRRRAPAPRRC